MGVNPPFLPVFKKPLLGVPQSPASIRLSQALQRREIVGKAVLTVDRHLSKL